MIAAPLVLSLALTGAPAPVDPPYVVVAWEVGNPESIWEVPQTYVAAQLVDVLDLDVLDESLPCGTYFQVDGYYANNDSAALIAGGVLYGPNNPTEPLAYGAVDGDLWKYVQTDPCPEPTPEPTPEPEPTVEPTPEPVETQLPTVPVLAETGRQVPGVWIALWASVPVLGVLLVAIDIKRRAPKPRYKRGA